MSKKVLWVLTGALSVAMIGLVIVQINWINSALQLKDEQFQQLVNTTLSDVSNQLDHYYTSTRLNKIIEEKMGEGEEMEMEAEMKFGTLPEILIREQELNKEIEDIERDIENKKVQIIGDTIITLTDDDGRIDTLHIKQYFELEKKEKLQQSLKKQELLISAYMKSMLLENIPFKERVERKQLEKFLQKNLLDKGINLDFEYAVINDNDVMVYQSDTFSKSTDCYYYRVGLMSNQLLENHTYLYLYFPGQKALVRESLGFLSWSSLILTLFMIIIFSFALYVIFKQKRLSEIKNDFVNNMTHELKTPISTISLASQMLSDASIPSEKKNTGHISRIIQTESKRLGYQVERVLQMAVLDQGHLVLKKDELEFSEIISSVVQNFKLQVESKNGTLEWKNEAQSDFIIGDKVHLTNVITNLIDNAVKYCRDTPEVTIHSYNENKSLICVVKDNGIGISKEDQKKVFDKFYRVATGNVHDVKGFGLGLSYVKLIVEEHGGTIKLSSEPNKGTSFKITLPLYTENIEYE